MKTLNLLILLFIFSITGCAKKDEVTTLQPYNVTPTYDPYNEPAQPVLPAEVNTINFLDNSIVYFDFDCATPKMSEENKIINQINYLKDHNFKKVIIAGHTDEYGTREYNLALGERRANAVRDIFVANGIDPRKIQVVSYGKEQISNFHMSAENRRTVTKIVY